MTKEKLLIFLQNWYKVKICRLPFKRDSKFLNCLGENVCLATAPKYFS